MRRLRLLAGLLAVALAVGACSSGSSESSDSSPADVSGASTASGSAANGDPIEIGVICACTGPAGADYTAATKVAQAWAKSVNADGGLGGHPVKLTVKNDSTDPGKSVTAVQGFISDKVDAILDITSMDSAWADAAAKAKIPVLAGNLNNPSFYTNPYFYPSGLTLDHAVSAYVLTAKQAGATNLGQLYCAESPSCQEALKPTKQAAKKYGVPVVYTAAIAGTAPNFTAQCLAAQQAGVKALFVAHVMPTVIRVIKDCSRQGYHPIYITAGSGFSNDLPPVVGAKDEVWTEFPILPFFADKPIVHEMNATVDKYYPEVRKQTSSWTVQATMAWTGMLLLQKAVEAAGIGPSDDPSPAAIVKGLNSLEGETLEGWSPPLTFTAGEPHSVDCWYVGRTSDGKAELVNDGKLTCQQGAAG